MILRWLGSFGHISGVSPHRCPPGSGITSPWAALPAGKLGVLGAEDWRHQHVQAQRGEGHWSKKGPYGLALRSGSGRGRGGRRTHQWPAQAYSCGRPEKAGPDFVNPDTVQWVCIDLFQALSSLRNRRMSEKGSRRWTRFTPRTCRATWGSLHTQPSHAFL